MTGSNPAGRGFHGGIALEQVGRYESGQFDEDAAEIIATGESVECLFVVNAELGGVDVLDVTSPDDPTRVDELVLGDVWDEAGEVTNVALEDDVLVDEGRTAVLAVAVVAADPQDAGRVVFYDAVEREPITSVEVGVAPDCVVFTPDRTRVLTADAGEPNDDYSRVPKGSVSVVDLRGGVEGAAVERAGFEEYDGHEDELRERGVRIFGPDAAASTHLEPEFLAVSADSSTAYVVLQVNNALAVVDVESATVEDVHAFGFKDHDRTGNELDASDVDRLCIRNWPIYGMYQPDAIETYDVDGETYLVTANEGTQRDDTDYDEVATVGELTLDPGAFDFSGVAGVDDVSDLQRPEHLGNLEVTTELGDVDDDGDYEELYAFGGRSFAVWTADCELVYDSGADFELLVAMHHPEHFNADGEENVPFVRSTAKGPEPEDITLGRIDDRTYAFVGLERIGSVVVYDVTDPREPSFVQYVNNRNFDVDPAEDIDDGDASASAAGDLGPEGVTFVPRGASPVGDPLVAVGNELSGTTTVYRVRGLRP